MRILARWCSILLAETRSPDWRIIFPPIRFFWFLALRENGSFSARDGSEYRSERIAGGKGKHRIREPQSGTGEKRLRRAGFLEADLQNPHARVQIPPSPLRIWVVGICATGSLRFHGDPFAFLLSNRLTPDSWAAGRLTCRNGKAILAPAELSNATSAQSGR